MRVSDYLSEINSDSFTDQFVNDVLNYLEEESTINMDSYQFTIVKKAPDTTSRKKRHSGTVAKEIIHYDPTETIPELLRREKVHGLDQTANEMGDVVIR